MYTAHFERFIRPARAYPQLWRLILGIVVIAFVFFMGFFVLFGLILAFSGFSGMQNWATKVNEASTPTSTLLLLASFVGLALATMLAARVLQHRKPGTLFGPRDSVIKDFVKSALIVGGIYACSTTGWLFFFDPVPNTDLGLWLTFLPLALVAVLIQTGAEELVFRGYLQQQLAARFRSPLAWIVLPSLVFGLMHVAPGASALTITMIVGSATVFGLVAADLTRITGSLGASWGFHFTNNVLAILVISVDGAIPGLALYLTPYSIDDSSQYTELFAANIVAVVFVWYILRRVLRR